jgi:hypothetical protein
VVKLCSSLSRLSIIMRVQLNKKAVVSPVLFIALVVISIVIVSQLVGRDGSSMLIDNGPTTPTDEKDDDDDGLRTVGDDVANHTDDFLSMALPTYTPTANYASSSSPPSSASSRLPSRLPTNQPSEVAVNNYATNAPSGIISQPAKQTSSPTLRPIASSPPSSASSRLPSRLPTNQPSEAAAKTTSSPSEAMPLSKLTPPPTTQPPSESPITSKPTPSPSNMPSPAPTKSPVTSSEPDTDQINEQPDDLTSFYHATNGCLKQGDILTDTCVAPEHTSSIPVNCCSGSESNGNLKCRRNGCFKTSSYNVAKNHCEREGMRLCTTTELTSGSCCDKGCGFNRQISWAADACEPTMSPTNAPTEEPTVSPTQRPTQSPTTRAGTLANFSSGDRSIGEDEVSSSLGLMFEVQALRDLAITSLSTFTASEREIWSEVWIRQGRYQGNTAGAAGWDRVYFKKSQHYGDSAPLDIVFDNQVFIPEGQIMSFYLVSPGKFLSDRASNVEGVIAEDNSLRLYTGAAIDYGRWEDGCSDDRECIFPARTFNGAINYATATMTPTAQPTPDPFIKQASGLTLREEQWLVGHNSRRKIWHEMYGKKYKPLKWSEGLKDMAQAYADELASVCGPTVHDSYENRGGYGECLASNTGHDEGHGSWGELKPVEKVMYRYVERENTWAPPANYHFTQVLWYPTEYVGCADSIGTMPSGAVCRYQVCRYARAGNCSVNSFNDGSKEWWMKAVMQDASNCRPYCPPEGC